MDQRALLFTDVVDSTALVQRLGDAAASALWAEHDRRARELLDAHNGREIDRSDGFFLLFDDVAHAARFAAAYHDAVGELGLAARVGMHLGSVILRHNRASDIARGAKPIEAEGLAKPLAARIMALACGGQTLLSHAARDALADAQPEGTHIDGHGHYRLKGVDEPVEVFELGRHGAAFAPPADSDKAYRVVLADGLWSPLREVRHNLAPERDAFVGRRRELRELAQRFEAGCRLLTLVGAGGTGKTRVARRYARTWLGEWPGGVYFCDLSEARSLDGIHFALALALEIALGKDDATQLGNAIAGRGRCLVILDNFEQVAEHAAGTLGRWVDRAANAAFLVTSRERLHLPGETVLEIAPLTFADEAVELFAVRAQAQQSSFVIDDANRSAVTRVVELLDGLPLAIELAAARVRILSAEQIVQRLQDRFHLLSGARGAAARQATLKATIDWSWELLQPWEQAALAQCSVFEGGFTLEAAEAVLDLTHWTTAPPVIDVVQTLVDKSLLRVWVLRGQQRLESGEPHFAMYLSIREYAAEKLAADGATLPTQRAHGAWFARLGDERFIASLSLHGGAGRALALSNEIDNLLAACRRAVRLGDAQIAVATYRAAGFVLLMQGPAAAGIALGNQVIAVRDADDSLRAAVCGTLGRLALRAGRVNDADVWLGKAIALDRAAGNERRELSNMARQADLFRQQGRVDEARAQFDAALPRIRQLGDPGLLGITLGPLGALHQEQGRLDDARECFEEAGELCRRVGDRRGEANALGNLANLHFDQGRFDEAAEGFSTCATMHRDMGDRAGAAHSLLNLGSLRERQGRHAEARQQVEAALAGYREVGARSFEGIALDILGLICRGQQDTSGARDRCLAALEIHRETGNRRYESLDLVHLGGLESDAGRLDDAERHLEQSIAISTRLGDRRTTAMASRDLAKVLLASQRATAAAEHLAAAECVLGEIGDAYELAVAWCIRGQLLIREGNPERAQSLLAAAEAAASATAANRESALGRAIAELGRALA
ncbi:MAG TPA: tetratricopeptide repeat protein [Caldimonas sp.]|nr:tetratricopeptide repeat protein [Caldimonas sp.]HEX4235595.1 tetratricopeptide repeat protein [Caldimonas sp.]